MLTEVALRNRGLEESKQDPKGEKDGEAAKRGIRKMQQKIGVLKQKLGREQLEKDAGLPAEQRLDLNLHDAASILNSPPWFRLWLRDACTCPLCVDPSTQQKLFQTSQIPDTLSFKTIAHTAAGTTLSVTWDSDIPGYAPTHTSTYSLRALAQYASDPLAVEGLRSSQDAAYVPWTRAQLAGRVQFLDYGAAMASDAALLRVLHSLQAHGLVFLTGVPGSDGPAGMGARLGGLRNTLYGATWDVRAAARPTNAAYTDRALGLHMDMLYLAAPPGVQLLQCVANSCAGGASLFVDGFRAVEELAAAGTGALEVLRGVKARFHYRNAGVHYRAAHATVVYDADGGLECVNYSPPFQAPFVGAGGLADGARMEELCRFRAALAQFQVIVEDEGNVFEYKMKEGEMVIFNNRRVLHARRAFDVAQGDRWMKGGCVDTDVVQSTLRVLREKYPGQTLESGLPPAGRMGGGM